MVKIVCDTVLGLSLWFLHFYRSSILLPLPVNMLPRTWNPFLQSTLAVMLTGPGACVSFTLVTDHQVALASAGQTRPIPPSGLQASETSIPTSSCLARLGERKLNTRQVCLRWKHWGMKGHSLLNDNGDNIIFPIGERWVVLKCWSVSF